MPSKPFVVLSSPAALGATLLGVSASLLALDVTGTVFLDRSRSANAVAPAAVAAAPVAAPATATAAPVPRTANVPRAAAPAPHVFAPRPVVATHARPLVKRVVASLARHASVIAVVPTGSRKPLAPIVVAQTSPNLHAVAFQPPQQPTRIEPHGERPIASLRDVRRFVIRTLRARDHRVCAISATAYTARDGHVVVDLVMRNRQARWSEKAVVRRNGTDLKLIGAKARALPYWTVASSGVVPGS